MKTLLQYSLNILMTILPLWAFAHDGWGGKYTETKTIKKEFAVAAHATVKIDNSYGNLDVVTWNENRVVFEITIETNGDDADKVKDKLDEITVEFDTRSDFVSAKTLIEKSSSSWWSWGKRKSVNMKINYLVKMPKTNNIDFSNDYGSINLDTTEGDVKISCDYGKITTKELLSSNNEITFDYTNNSYFEYIKKGRINADYSGFTVSKTKDLEIVADYTKSVVEVAENLSYNCDYGGITIDKANNIVGKGAYLNTKIGVVYKSLDLNADYGAVKIDKVAPSANTININSDYVSVKMGVAPAFNFNFDIDLGYGSLKAPDAFEFNKKKEERFSKSYQGYFGQANSGKTVNISSDYGGVTIYVEE